MSTPGAVEALAAALHDAYGDEYFPPTPYSVAVATTVAVALTERGYTLIPTADLDALRAEDTIPIGSLPLGFSRERWALMSSLVGHVRLYGLGMIPDHPAPDWLIKAVERYDEQDALDPVRGRVGAVEDVARERAAMRESLLGPALRDRTGGTE